MVHVDSADDALQQLDGGCGLPPRLRIGQRAQHVGQQGMAALAEQVLREVADAHGGQPVQPRQQQRVGQRLGVGVGELGRVGVGKEGRLPVPPQLGDGGTFVV